MEFSRQKYWSELSCPPPGDLPDLGIEPTSHVSCIGRWIVVVCLFVCFRSRTGLSDFTFTFHFHALEKEIATHSSVLAWRISGTADLVGCCLWGHTESGMTEAT